MPHVSVSVAIWRFSSYTISTILQNKSYILYTLSHKWDFISQSLPVGQFLEQYPMLQRGQLLKQWDVGLVSGGDTGGSELLKQ